MKHSHQATFGAIFPWRSLKTRVTVFTLAIFVIGIWSLKNRIMEASLAPGRFQLIDRFMQGYEGTGILVNPLGVEVLQSAKGIPAAGWYATAELPAEETFAPIRDVQRRVLLAAIFLTLLAGGLTLWMVRRLLSPMFAAVKTLATLSDAGQPPRPLPVTRQDEIGELIGGFNRLLETLGQREAALLESEGKYRNILESIEDGYFEVDIAGNLTFFNDSICRMLGNTRAGMMGMNNRRYTDKEAGYLARRQVD